MVEGVGKLDEFPPVACAVTRYSPAVVKVMVFTVAVATGLEPVMVGEVPNKLVGLGDTPTIFCPKKEEEGVEADGAVWGVLRMK